MMASANSKTVFPPRNLTNIYITHGIVLTLTHSNIQANRFTEPLNKIKVFKYYVEIY
jgi:hypothetical protein